MKIIHLTDAQTQALGWPEHETHMIVTATEQEVAESSMRIHDLNAAIRRITTMRKMLDEGFDFTAVSAKALLLQLDQAIATIEQEAVLSLELLEKLK